MVKNVTFFLGAGASYNALPVLNEMIDGMTQLKIFLEQGDFQNENRFRVIEDLRWIIEQSNDYFTIDTLAKKFYIQNRRNDLIRLKRGLSAFFILEQFRHKTPGQFTLPIP